MISTQITKQDKTRLLAKLNQETAIIPFQSLQRFFAQGRILIVKEGLDLVNIAANIANDQAIMIKQQIEQQKITYLSDDQARQWLGNDEQVWALVIVPWVLVQPRKNLKTL